MLEFGFAGTPDDVVMNMPLADGRRRNLYNLHSESLDARKVAAAKLAMGVTPKVTRDRAGGCWNP